MSLAARLFNVFAVPGEVFEDVKSAPISTANWLVPVLIAVVVGVISVNIMFSQPAIIQQIHEQQESALEKQVKAGKITRAQADQMITAMEKFTGPTMMKIFGSAGAVFTPFVGVFLVGLLMWLFGRWFLKAEFSYMKTVEVVGLGSMIALLGSIVTLLLIVNFSSLTATPSLALAVHDFDPKNRLHLLLATLNIFSLWHVAVLSTGLARLAAVPFARAALVLFGLWAAWRILLILAGSGMAAM